MGYRQHFAGLEKAKASGLFKMGGELLFITYFLHTLYINIYIYTKV